MKNNKLKVVAAYDSAADAHIASMQLDNEGIVNFITDENIVCTNWFYTVATGGVKILAAENEIVRAREILNLKSSQQPSEQTQLVCPYCSSPNIEYQKYSKKLFFISILLFRFPLPLPKDKWFCLDCNKYWSI
jgi:hypothetical protein